MPTARGRAVNRFLILSLALVVGVGAAVFIWVQSSLPRKTGEVQSPELIDRVTVLRDTHGIPYIYANNDRDSAFALGFAHAQDRLWQMELQRRLGAGRLSEILGSRTLAVDRTMRTMGFYRHAEASLVSLSPDVQKILHAYSAGVNAWLTGRPGALPPEFLLLRHTPEPWQPADSIVWGKLMGERLSGNFRDELIRARLRNELSDEEIDTLWPPYPSDAPRTTGEHASLLPVTVLDRMIAHFGAGHVTSEASNAWAVHGSRTDTGKPILANDPHLRFDAPILWYLARLETPTLKLSGATVPGLPVFLLGHNQYIAWGLTATQADLQDIFVERIDPSDPGRYLTPTGWRAFDRRTEIIKVRDEADNILIVRSSRHGPVISDIFGVPHEFAADGRHVAVLSATYLTDQDRSAEALIRINRARSVDELNRALKFHHTPVLNVIFADTAGDIGFVTAGKVPLRARGHGYVPHNGWDGRHDWYGFAPHTAMPSRFNPAKGFIASANNPVSGRDENLFISRDWAAPYRAQRIEQALQKLMPHRVSASATLQMNAVSAMATELAPILIKKTVADGGQRSEALKLINKWDGGMGRNRPEPAIFTAWLRALNQALYVDELGSAFANYWGLRPRLVRQLLSNGSSWCDDIRTPNKESCETIVTGALTTALKELATRFPNRAMANWRWGDLHQARFDNPVLRGVKFLGRLTTLTIPSDGGGFTVNRGTMRIRNTIQPYAHIHGAGYRAVYDLADLSASRFVIATGQSGIFFSPHYSDFLERWRDGGFVRLNRTRVQLNETGKSIYTLLPK